MKLVLASASPRRRELLAAAGIPFRLAPAPGVDETPLPGELPEAYVLRLAQEKALSVRPAPGEVVLGADTVVVAGGEMLGKPADAADAARMLERLSGRTHEVITGVCLAFPGFLRADSATTFVRFSPLLAEEIAAYIVSGEPMDKAGAYGIQGRASRFVERIEGCYFNVVGLPVSLVCRMWREATGTPLGEFGISPQA